MTKPKHRIVSRNLICDNWIRLEELTIESGRLNDPGKLHSVNRFVHHHGSGACVLPYDAGRDCVLLVRQLRAPLVWLNLDDCWLIEAAAGLVDDGETPKEAIQREVVEELGYRCHSFVPLPMYYSSPGSVTEQVFPFLARYSQTDKHNDGGGLASEGEDIEVLEMSLVELSRLFRDGKIQDSKLQLCLLALLAMLPGKREVPFATMF